MGVKILQRVGVNMQMPPEHGSIDKLISLFNQSTQSMIHILLKVDYCFSSITVTDNATYMTMVAAMGDGKGGSDGQRQMWQQRAMGDGKGGSNG